MARTKTDAAERTRQNQRLVGRASMEAGVSVGRPTALARASGKPTDVVYPQQNHRLVHPKTPAEPREFITRGITGQLTHDRELDFEPHEVSFVGDIIVEISDIKFYRGGTVVMNVQTTDDFMDTIVDAARLSRGHPLFCRLFELFPKPASPWADGTHPDDPHEPTPGQPWGLQMSVEERDAHLAEMRGETDEST